MVWKSRLRETTLLEGSFGFRGKIRPWPESMPLEKTGRSYETNATTSRKQNGLSLSQQKTYSQRRYRGSIPPDGYPGCTRNVIFALTILRKTALFAPEKPIIGPIQWAQIAFSYAISDTPMARPLQNHITKIVCTNLSNDAIIVTSILSLLQNNLRTSRI